MPWVRSFLPKANRLLVAAALLGAQPIHPENPVIVPAPPVRCGIDTLIDSGFQLLKKRQVGLITNHTAVDFRGMSTADLLQRAPGVKLVALFSPEHGIRGQREHGQVISDMIDPRTGLPVYSLYGETKRPTPAMLNAIDVLVYDIQDVGSRFYTYITTMGLAMEAAAQRNIAFVVLDRPNPVGGDILEGPPLDSSIKHFTAYFPIPARYGMTPGEVARWYKAKAGLDVDLQVVPLQGWSRRMLWPETKRSFVAPSPNIRTPMAALLYQGIGMFEATNLSVGRGTKTPFEIIGAPWLKGDDVARRLNALGLPGVRFQSESFTPTSDVFAKTLCSGIRFEVTDPDKIRPVEVFVHISFLLRELNGKDFQLRSEDMLRMTGSRDFEKAYKSGKSADDVIEIFRKDAHAFEEERKPYLLY